MPQSESISLFFTEGSSDKVYQVQLVEDPAGWSVTFQNGRRGKPLRGGEKGTGMPYDVAKTVYDKLVKSKTSKGYTPEESGIAFSGTEHAGEVTGFRPQLLNEISIEALDTLGDDWLVQEKHDGERRGVSLSKVSAIFSNRRGLAVGVATAIHEATLDLHRIVGPLKIDCEDMGSRLVIFDVQEHFMMGPDSAFRIRAAILGHLEKTIHDAGLLHALEVDCPVPLVDFLRHGGVERLRNGGGEGFVLRRASSVYTPGRPSSGGDALKVKFWEDATCRVTSGRDGLRSVGLELMDEQGDWTPVGNVTVPANAAIPEAGTLIDVKYLYAYEGGSLFEPSFRGVRDDLDESACVMSQLKLKGQGPRIPISDEVTLSP